MKKEITLKDTSFGALFGDGNILGDIPMRKVEIKKKLNKNNKEM